MCPNWCEGTLAISGPEDEVRRLKEFAKGKVGLGSSEETVLSAEKFIPYPLEQFERASVEEEEKLAPATKIIRRLKGWEPPDHYNMGGYEWCVGNWGTKWGFCNPELVESSGNIYYYFETAWSPIIPVVKKMGEMFPKLRISYEYKDGQGFQGSFEMEGGKVLLDATEPYNDTIKRFNRRFNRR